MVRRDLVSRLALIALVLVTVVAVGCSSGKKPNNNNNNDEPPAPTIVTGTVFQDLDSNGIKSATEIGIPNVVVSNGLTSTTTGANGSFTFTIDAASLPTVFSIFVTTPKDYAPSGPWYKSFSGTQFDFGLKAAPERNSDNFTFIQMTDIHLDANNMVTFNKAVEEFKKISSAFVVSTGDLVNTGDTKTISVAQAAEWFGKYNTAISGLSMPVYNALGNHDAANLACELAAGATAGCSKSAYRTSFGPTYYSFDWGQYHCVVLDPNEVKAGGQVFEINASQLAWLQKDLSYRAKSSPLLVFFHEPTTAWQSQASVLNLLKQYKTRIFTGHAHEDLLMDSQGIPEQVTAALSGEWGHGDNPDGSKPGYRIVSIVGDVIDTFYKEIDSVQQIEISPAGATWPIVSGQVELVAKVYSDNGTVSGVTYSVDNATALDMTPATGSKWVTATASWNTASLSPDYHKIVVTATDNTGVSFQTETEVKVSAETTLTIKDLQDHLRTYQGHYVTIKGTVEMAMFNTGVAPVGAGGAVIVDNSVKGLIYAGECYNPPLTTVETGSPIQVRVIPMRFTWAFMTTTLDREGTFDQFAVQEGLGMIPAGQKEDDNGTKVARWFMRLVTADGIT
jgi:hypothetical protein